MSWQGTWSVSTSYGQNTAVAYNGSSYLASDANTGVTPPTTPWVLMASKGDQGIQGIQGIQGPAGTVSAAGPGTAALPSISFTGDPDTGLYSSAANILGVAQGGATRLLIDGIGLQVYEVRTDPANFSRMQLDFSGGAARILTFAAGTGTPRDLWVGTEVAATSLYLRAAGANRWTLQPAGHLVGVVDNTYDIGQTGPNLRPRTIYAGTSVVTPALRVTSPGAFVAADKYLVVDASGNVHVSALGPAS